MDDGTHPWKPSFEVRWYVSGGVFAALAMLLYGVSFMPRLEHCFTWFIMGTGVAAALFLIGGALQTLARLMTETVGAD